MYPNKERCFHVQNEVSKVMWMFPSENCRFQVDLCFQINYVISKVMLFLNYVSKLSFTKFFGMNFFNHLHPG